MRKDYDKVGGILAQSDDIVLLCHVNPDGDTLGSAFALCHALRSMGKRVSVLCSDPPPQKYPPIIGGAPGQTADFEPGLVVSVDIATEDLFGSALAPYQGRVDISIDHHPSNTMYARLNLVEPDAAATGEIIYTLLKTMNAAITKETAVCIYAAISTDTGGFRFSNTSSKTLEIASRMYRFDADFGEINRILFLQKSRRQVELERKAFDSMRYYRKGAIASIAITLDDIDQTGATVDDLEAISNIPRYIEGVETGFAMREMEPGTWKISARSGVLDVSKVCMLFGGGGHVRAAGCTITGEKEDVRKSFAAALIDAVNAAGAAKD